MNELRVPAGAAAPFTSSSVRRVSQARKTGNKSLGNLTTGLRKGDRQEGLIWLVLTLSAAMLIVLRLWI